MRKKIQKLALLLRPKLQALKHMWSRFQGFAGRLKPFLTAKNALIAGTGLILLAGGLAVSFFWPRTVAFSFAENNCFTQPVLLPDLISKKDSPTYKAEPVASLSIAGYPLFSRTTCVTPQEPPKENTSEAIRFGVGFLTKKIQVSTGTLPAINQTALDSPISPNNPLTLALHDADRVFDYRLVVADKTLDCGKQGNAIVCDVAKMSLAQSANYTFQLERVFRGQAASTVFSRPVKTVEAVYVASSSIASEQTMYDAPSDITLTLNRPAVSMEGARLYLVNGESRQEVPISATLTAQTIAVHFNEPLARSASFVLTIEKLAAADGGFLAAPFALNFKTSGGPKVTGINVGSSKVDPSANIVLTFDANVKTDQPLGNFIKVEVNGAAVGANITVKGNKLTINPAADLPLCAQFTVRVLNGLQNEFGISGGSAWERKSRVQCKVTFSIGSSVKGRGITAYKFGSGASKVIFVGGTHGDEKSSVYSLNSLADYLEANPDKIPAHRTIIIIPNLNPDGFAAGTRTNANKVDLNRNFPANSWKQGVTMPGGSFNPNGGGSAPLSEPESRALANYVVSQSPRLVLTYHAVAGVVIPNDSGDSDALAHVYDQKSNVGYAPNSHTGSIFHYDTTGAFEDWLHDKPGIPALLVELWTKSGNEFAKNQNAMLHMVQLP